MSQPVIQVEGLSKQYVIGERAQYTALRHLLGDALKAPLRMFRPARPQVTNHRPQNIWALKDVSFEVKEGEVLGLIGRNGAGKSTLLKILARITPPTSGHAEIHGRIGSLLEVGTGFHPELTGRENVYLSGAVLGMKKKEIERKFDEIVAFSEVEQFIDTPLKHYSTGMQMRLAFAVAAHLEPEILLVDEVLAVGDITFQKKCLGKMSDVARAGRTVIVVSHAMSVINALCGGCIVLEGGSIIFDGPSIEATARYYADSLNLSGDGLDLLNRPREGNGKARFSSISIQPLNSEGEPLDAAHPGCDLSLDIELKCERSFSDCLLAIIFYDSNGYRVIDTNTAQKGEFVSLKAGQTARANFLLREVLLRPGKYFVGLWLGRHTMETVDHIEHATTLDFLESEETSQHSVIYPGIYLCRFEQSVSIC